MSEIKTNLEENVEDEPIEIENDQAALDAAAGLEYEEEDGDFTGSFDPRKIRMSSDQLTLDILLNRIRDNRIDLQPDFQRMAGVWDARKKSRLIESLLIRIPLPSFYIDASDDDKWLIIDGLQRLTTLREFVIEKKWKLQDLEFLTNDNGKGYDDLERAMQRRLEETRVTVYAVQEGTPPEVKYNIFKRINTGGSPLSAQEIRNALFQGKSTRLLRELAESEIFQTVTGGSIKPIRMADREIVLRFLAFALTPLEDYKSNEFDKFMNDTMSRINKMSDEEIALLRIRFARAMDASFKILDKYAFRKIYPSGRRGTINRALVDAWAVNIDQLSDAELKYLTTHSSRKLLSKFKVLLDDEDFSASISYSTGDPKRVKRRFAGVRQILEEVLHA